MTTALFQLYTSQLRTPGMYTGSCKLVVHCEGIQQFFNEFKRISTCSLVFYTFVDVECGIVDSSCGDELCIGGGFRSAALRSDLSSSDF